MRVANLLVGLIIAVVSWFAVLILWGVLSEYLYGLLDMRGGDVEAPWVVMIGGGLFALALIFVVMDAIIWGVRPRALALLGSGCAVFAEFYFCDYLYRQRRFLTQAYLDLPGVSHPTMTLEQFALPVWSAIIGHVAVAAALLTLTYVVLGWRRTEAAA